MELALIFPAMMVAFFGTYEITQLVRVYMNLGLSSAVVADLLARNSPDTPGEITDACNGGKMIMLPFVGTNFNAAVASVTNKSGTITLNWSNTTSCGTGAAAIASPTTLAATLVPNAGDSVIIVQTNYSYTALTSFVLNQTYTISHLGYARPRLPGGAS